MTLKYTFVALCLLANQVMAGDHLVKDREAILAMAGSYVVDFHFKETVGFLPGYELKPPKDSAALEQVFVIEASDKKISLQHILQTSRGIVKHWRQDWEFEPTHLWEFQVDQTWKKRPLDKEAAKGQWVQRVYQVDDSPRYEALGAWQHIGNLSEWNSQPTRRPLPRREYTTRDDYNVMIAKNRHALTPTGWVHEQDNYKLNEDGSSSTVVAREFGLNRYDHTDPKKLAEAKTWWRDNGQVWHDIRDVWQEQFTSKETLSFAKAIDDKPLLRHLSRLAQESALSKNYKSEALKEEVRDLLKDFSDAATTSIQTEATAATSSR